MLNAVNHRNFAPAVRKTNAVPILERLTVDRIQFQFFLTDWV
jgi:hypothetical protein